MSKYYYKKSKELNYRGILRVLGIGLVLSGVIVFLYIFSPLILWQVYFAKNSSENLKTPIPKVNVVNASTVRGLILQAKDSVGVDYTNAQNWFPTFKASATSSQSPSYSLSIPSIDIKDAIVSTSDYDLSKHLVNYQGTSNPPGSGNSVVFGHSTLPQLYNPTDYKTIFANAHKLKIGNSIYANVGGVSYQYKIFDISIVDANDTSLFSQNYDNSYLTLVTCTPPGTIWKRLVIKARLEKI